MLSQGTFLFSTSNPSRTSPVKRGLFVLENLLAIEPPPSLEGEAPLYTPMIIDQLELFMLMEIMKDYEILRETER